MILDDSWSMFKSHLHGLGSHGCSDTDSQATALVSAALGETIKFMISVPGTGREQFFSRPGALEETGMT